MGLWLTFEKKMLLHGCGSGAIDGQGSDGMVLVVVCGGGIRGYHMHLVS